MNDITCLEDIKILVNDFYGRIREDNLLGPIFNAIIQDRWEEHLEKMYRFWQTVLLDVHSYFGSPFPAHAKMPIAKEHFNQWLLLFKNTVDELYQGDIADKAKWQGERMAEMFEFKISYYKSQDIG